MQRRSFLKASGIALGAGLAADSLLAKIPPHNFDKYDFGGGPPISDRLYQGPFSADDYPSWNVVMALTGSHDVVPNYGMGLITYVCDEVGPAKKAGETLAQSIENIVKLPLGTKLYLRVNWKDVQQRPGRLDFCEHWKQTFELARKYQKRIGFRVMMSNPDITESPLPEFLRDKIPMVKLGDWLGRTRYEPQYDDPAFQAAFRELVDLLADSYDGHPDVEYVDTFMYGFWGEGHTWPLETNPFPDNVTAENTFVSMLQHQLQRWKKTQLVTNTQPDFSKVGNSELVDRTVRSNNWIRSDTIFIENEQIEALSNRPPWIAALLEQGLPGKPPDPGAAQEGISPAENMIDHVMDIGANYWSLWNFHQISAKNLTNYYQTYPAAFDRINRRIGYRVRPSFIWRDRKSTRLGLI